MGKRADAVFVLCAMTAIALPAQTFTTLHRFDGTDGADPVAGLVQATNGDFYGTTFEGGAGGCAPSGCGTVFKITPNGTLTALHKFCAQSGCPDGWLPEAALVQAATGDFYGTTSNGGVNGTIFKITPSGTLTTLHTFCSQRGCLDGSSALVQATDGDFYGASGGGVHGGGAIFRMTPSGALTTLYSFCSQSGCPDGSSPMGLVQATDGDFYGTTHDGGSNGYGTVFKITPSGTLTTLYSFCAQANCTDGSSTLALPVQATNGDFYGTTAAGGTNCADTGGCGTVFKITPSGTLTTLYSFCAQTNCADGVRPNGLVQGTDGNFYGTTSVGGANCPDYMSCGTVFQITPSGTLTTLYSFCAQSGCTDGEASDEGAALLQATNGNFYGTAEYGGSHNHGTIFSMSVGLAPFVKTEPHAGDVGAAINILGDDLTGTTSVSFNGTAATFTVASPTLITTIVPAGATTGKVQVTIPVGTLFSGGPFVVLP